MNPLMMIIMMKIMKIMTKMMIKMMKIMKIMTMHYNCKGTGKESSQDARDQALCQPL